MSIVVVVGTDSRTLYQSADTNGLLDKLSTFTNWQELVFGSVPLPIPDQVGIKIHPGTITATSILFEYHQLPSSFTIESTASTVIGICVLWSSPLITKKHNHRISCLLENLKCDVERALRDNSHYLLSHLIDEFVRHHQVSPLTSSICSSHTPSLSTCLQFLEPIVGLKLVSDVLTDALVSYYSPRRQKLVIFSQKSSNLLQHLLFTIHHIFVMITSRSDLDRPTKTLHTEPLFIQDDLDEKVTWFDDENVDNSPVNESFSRDCNNSIEPAACSPAFVAENNFIGERAGRIMSSEEESLGYFSSSSSQGSTIAIEGCNNDDVNGNSEIEREICSNFKSLDSCRNDSELLTGQRVVNQDDVVQEATASVKSDGLSSFQEVLREYRDLRFRANTSTLSPKHKSDGRQVFSSRNISTPCIIAVRETDGFLHTFHQSSSSSSSSSYASNTSASSSHPQYLGKMHLLQSDTCTQENVMIHVENLVNLGSHGNYLSPHYLVQGLNMAKGDRIDNHIAYLSRCSCQQCVYSDHSCHFKTLDLDLLTQKNNMSSLTIDGQGFILEILQSALELKKLGLSDDNVTDFIRCKLQHELPVKAALVRSCVSSGTSTASYSPSATIKGCLEESIRSLSLLPLDASRDASFSWTEASRSFSSLVNSLSFSSRKVTSSIKSAINDSFNQLTDRNHSNSPATLSISSNCRVFWKNLGIYHGDLELLSCLPSTSISTETFNGNYSSIHTQSLESFL